MGARGSKAKEAPQPSLDIRKEFKGYLQDLVKLGNCLGQPGRNLNECISDTRAFPQGIQYIPCTEQEARLVCKDDEIGSLLFQFTTALAFGQLEPQEIQDAKWYLAQWEPENPLSSADFLRNIRSWLADAIEQRQPVGGEQRSVFPSWKIEPPSITEVLSGRPEELTVRDLQGRIFKPQVIPRQTTWGAVKEQIIESLQSPIGIDQVDIIIDGQKVLNKTKVKVDIVKKPQVIFRQPVAQRAKLAGQREAQARMFMDFDCTLTYAHWHWFLTNMEKFRELSGSALEQFEYQELSDEQLGEMRQINLDFLVDRSAKPFADRPEQREFLENVFWGGPERLSKLKKFLADLSKLTPIYITSLGKCTAMYALLAAFDLVKYFQFPLNGNPTVAQGYENILQVIPLVQLCKPTRTKVDFMQDYSQGAKFIFYVDDDNENAAEFSALLQEDKLYLGENIGLTKNGNGLTVDMYYTILESVEARLP